MPRKYKPIKLSKLPKPRKFQRLKITHIQYIIKTPNIVFTGIVVVDADGKVGAGTTTNGLTYKIPGCV